MDDCGSRDVGELAERPPLPGHQLVDAIDRVAGDEGYDVGVTGLDVLQEIGRTSVPCLRSALSRTRTSHVGLTRARPGTSWPKPSTLNVRAGPGFVRKSGIGGKTLRSPVERRESPAGAYCQASASASGNGTGAEMC